MQSLLSIQLTTSQQRSWYCKRHMEEHGTVFSTWPMPISRILEWAHTLHHLVFTIDTRKSECIWVMEAILIIGTMTLIIQVSIPGLQWKCLKGSQDLAYDNLTCNMFQTYTIYHTCNMYVDWINRNRVTQMAVFSFIRTFCFSENLKFVITICSIFRAFK